MPASTSPRTSSACLSVRLRLAGFSTTQMLAEELLPACAAEGWRAEVSQASSGRLLPSLMSPQEGRDGLLVLLDLDGFAPRDWRNSAADGFNLLAERAELLGDALAAFAERSSVPLLINTIPSASAPTAGLLDRRHEMGLRRSNRSHQRAHPRRGGSIGPDRRHRCRSGACGAAALTARRAEAVVLWPHRLLRRRHAGLGKSLCAGLAAAAARAGQSRGGRSRQHAVGRRLRRRRRREARVRARFPRQCLLGDAAGMPSAEESGAAARGAEQEQRRCDHSLRTPSGHGDEGGRFCRHGRELGSQAAKHP